jgi:hypothetical protein
VTMPVTLRRHNGFSLLQEARSETPEPETYEEFFKGFY